MSQRFSGQKLKELRQAAIPKITQQALADKLGVCRETVVAIENEKDGSINSLPISTIQQWYEICSPNVSTRQSDKFLTYVMKFFGIRP